MVTLTLWRADKQPGRSTFGPLTSWAATQRHAHDYTESANFGGPVLYRAIVTVPASKILDLRPSVHAGLAAIGVDLEDYRGELLHDMLRTPGVVQTLRAEGYAWVAYNESRDSDPTWDEYLYVGESRILATQSSAS